MDAQAFLAEFGHIANAPGGVARLRELIFELAGQGRLFADCEQLEPIPLGKIADFVMGQAPPGPECNTNGNGVVFVKTGEFGDLYPIVREWTTKPLKFAQQGDVLICVVGATIGKLNLGIDCAIGRSVAAIRPKNSLKTKFLFYSLMPFTLLLRKGSRGSAQGVIGKSELSAVLLRVPDESEQSRIVAKVDELMALCDKLETQQQARRKLQNALRQSTLQAVATAASPHELQTAWARLAGNFGEFFYIPEDVAELRSLIWDLAVKGLLTKQLVTDEPASYLLDRIDELRSACKQAKRKKRAAARDSITSEEGAFGLPKSWSWVTLSALGDVKTGKTPSTANPKLYGGNIPFIGPGQITSSGEILHSEKTISNEGELAAVVAEVGCVMMVCIGGSIGKSCIVSRRVAVNQQINYISPVLVLPSYLFIVLQSKYFQNMVLSEAKGSATPIISGSKWQLLPVPLAPIEEQQRIVYRVTELMRFCDSLESQLRHANKLAGQLAATAVSTLTGIAPEQEATPPMKLPQTELIAPLRLGQIPAEPPVLEA